MQKKNIPIGIILLLQLFCLQLSAQKTIKGKVIDKITREPLESVIIDDPKTLQSTLTDRLGFFVFKNTHEEDTLIFSCIGYKTKNIQLTPLNDLLPVELEKGAVDLSEIAISSHYNAITSSHILSRIDINMQPVKSAQDLLRLVPGLFIAQHQGGGKAEQIFLRGFDADHGTDVAISVDGMPVNMVSQAHGQGYADLHFLIPETLAGYDFGKGPYYANHGDFNTAGYVAYNTKNILSKDLIKLEGAQYNTMRLVTIINLLGKHAQQGKSAYIAGEGLYSNGPFDYPEHFNRVNLFAKFITPVGLQNKLSVIFSALNSTWRASGEIPGRAMAEGYIKNRFGVIDTGQGGSTNRINALVKLTSTLNNKSTWENEAYYSHYYFNLISDFTFYYFYPQAGDEFGQHEMRNMLGYTSTLYHKSYIGDVTLSSNIGVGVRYDCINPSWLSHTSHGDSILNYIQLGKAKEANANVYMDETLEKNKWLFNVGVRVDYFYFDYQNMAPAIDSSAKIFNNVSPTAQKIIICPKINIQYTLNPRVQAYIKIGKGFHSNDARIVIANQGYQILPSAYGTDVGINWKPIPKLLINTVFWYLYLQQEFTYGADLGGHVSPGGKTQRTGIDFSARYQIAKWLYASENINIARPKFIDSVAGHNYIPLAPTFTSTAALDFKFNDGINGGISYRYLRNRSANSTKTLTAEGYFVTDLTINYTKPGYEVGITVENLFNHMWNESEFEYTSQLKNETQPVDEVSYTPGIPFFAKLKFTLFF